LNEVAELPKLVVDKSSCAKLLLKVFKCGEIGEVNRVVEWVRDVG